jgi:UDP-glucose 4-epimerase
MVDLNKTILISGSSGFIGKNIAQSLMQKFTLLTPSRKKLVLLSQSKVHKFFLRNEIDFEIHCANFGGNRKTLETGEVNEKNTRMFFNLAENQDHFTRLINLGSEALESSGNNARPLEHMYLFLDRDLLKKEMLI